LVDQKPTRGRGRGEKLCENVGEGCHERMGGELGKKKLPANQQGLKPTNKNLSEGLKKKQKVREKAEGVGRRQFQEDTSADGENPARKNIEEDGKGVRHQEVGKTRKRQKGFMRRK